jgi:hypothetical protein
VDALLQAAIESRNFHTDKEPWGVGEYLRYAILCDLAKRERGRRPRPTRAGQGNHKNQMPSPKVGQAAELVGRLNVNVVGLAGGGVHVLLELRDDHWAPLAIWDCGWLAVGDVYDSGAEARITGEIAPV